MVRYHHILYFRATWLLKLGIAVCINTDQSVIGYSVVIGHSADNNFLQLNKLMQLITVDVLTIMLWVFFCVWEWTQNRTKPVSYRIVSYRMSLGKTSSVEFAIFQKFVRYVLLIIIPFSFFVHNIELLYTT